MNKNKSEQDVVKASIPTDQASPESRSLPSVAHLQADLKAAYATRLNLRRERLSGQLKKPHLLRNNRREIARLKTAIHSKSSGR